MCGISAWFSEKTILIKDFNNFRDSVAHRGPDNSQTKIYKYDNKFVALGHRRLSIIDLNDKANQPMSYGSYQIVFNGEIYNYLELKDELKKKGVTFETNSDTEVLLKSYIYWKEKCLDKFNGMFSFLIVDEDKEKIFFARDRFGIKPLYYYRDDHTFYFASEIKQFITLRDFKPVGNINAIGNFIDNRYLDYSEETFFKDVFQVRGGEAGFVNLKNLKMDKYIWYDLNKKNIKSTATFKEKFNKSIDYRLRSDVEVGSCLSGGVDSSSIVCLADKKLSDAKKKYTLQTFTSCFKDKEFDERDLIKITKKQTSIKTHYIFPQEKEFFKDIDKLIYFQDEPFWSSSIYAQSCVFKEANKNGVKVMLDGQ
ncbi:asparagine synthase (glutamine-hydrolyzing), partial [Candidatus Pelagibacter ubique]|nr:asparagine synthase (glutamine-hydrolyzing) [Candidatus Pelagibacter ubique]